jgi:translation initiation factor 2 subunit 3
MHSLNIKEIMMKQPIINVGTIGHVANGKSTTVERISSKQTQQFAKERERNITIRLGYANAKIWKCDICDEPQCYSSSDSAVMEKYCNHCNAVLELINHISFVDCPGHSELTAVMINGSSVMDYAILVEACVHENIPAPQTAEHLIATRAAAIPTAMIIMNKIDLINKTKAYEQINKITDYVKKLTQLDVCPPIIPVSASLGINMDVVCHQIGSLKVPSNRNPNDVFKMIAIRSFDINKPGCDVTKLHGGVIGGTIMRGSLRIGDKITVYPGFVEPLSADEKEQSSKGTDFKYSPFMGRVLSIHSDKNELECAIPGGLLAVQLTIDPGFSRDDKLIGSVILKTSDVDADPTIVNVYDKIIVKINNFLTDKQIVEKLLKVKKTLTNDDNHSRDDENDDNSSKDSTCSEIKKPQITININSNNIDCVVDRYHTKKQELFLILRKPVAIDSRENLVTLMHKNNGKENDILGRGVVVDGVCCKL